MRKPVRVVIADDHPVVRAGLEGMLSAQPEFEVVGQAADGAEASRLATRLKPDVVLMDLRMPEVDGVAAIKEIKVQNPEVHILVLTTYDSDADILRAVEAGATGYMLKDAPREDLFRAVKAAANGEPLLAPRVADRLMRRMREPERGKISGRELEILGLVARGKSNKDIAKTLHISEATVKTHLVHTFSKLGVDDRTAAVTVALERGILHLNR